jgi:hypothetical protein
MTVWNNNHRLKLTNLYLYTHRIKCQVSLTRQKMEQGLVITGSRNEILEHINQAEYGAHYLLIHPGLRVRILDNTKSYSSDK